LYLALQVSLCRFRQASRSTEIKDNLSCILVLENCDSLSHFFHFDIYLQQGSVFYQNRHWGRCFHWGVGLLSWRFVNFKTKNFSKCKHILRRLCAKIFYKCRHVLRSLCLILGFFYGSRDTMLVKRDSSRLGQLDRSYLFD